MRPLQSPVLGVQPQFMLVPSLACEAGCSYCFGPHSGPVMDAATLNAALDFMAGVCDEAELNPVRVTFHGGEPLLAGHAFWEQALVGIRSRSGRRRTELGVQSNLWLLDDAFCRLFGDYRVEVGTSLDGPETITDAQRGNGYFARTMRGIRRAQAHGLNVGCIATFTPATVSRWREIFDFFLEERISFSIHAAVPGLDSPDTRHALSPDEYGALLCEMLEYYIAHRRTMPVPSLDQLCQAVARAEGKVCSFRDCLGMFLAIDPAGDIYPCQRFCGRPSYRFGNLADKPALNTLLSSATALRFKRREEQVHAACGGCAHFDGCRGGCPYNAWARPGNGAVKDPYCTAYRHAFNAVQGRLLQEMTSEANVQAMAERPYDGTGHPLLRRGPLTEIARPGPHPSEVARNARRIVAAVELARGPDLSEVAARLTTMGICRSRDSAEESLANLERDLHPETCRLNNLYLHVTLGCQLGCTHCYSRSRHVDSPEAMPAEAVVSVARQAREAGFRQLIVTGGEPLTHPGRDDILRSLAAVRTSIAGMSLVLRTNLAMTLSDEDLLRVAEAFDQVVVSVDGNRDSHDARRGQGGL